jgi:effector-binding domain-containing protein
MTYAVEIQDVAPQPLAAVRLTTRRAELATAIRGSLDKVYALLRGRGVEGLGHNVVVYRKSSGWTPDDTLDIEVGVQTQQPILPEGDVVALHTPSGRVATATHWGRYDKLGDAARALHAWIAANGLAYGGVDWEVYGDWDDDWSKVRTDVFFKLEEAGA